MKSFMKRLKSLMSSDHDGDSSSSPACSAEEQESQPETLPTGSMVVNSEPQGAMVYVDDMKKGETPCTMSVVSVGPHKIKVVKSGYMSAELSVNVSGGSQLQLYYSLGKSITEPVTSSSSSPSNYSSPSGRIANHDYIDLGLSVKWATCNVGADRPEDYGNYYAWGEASPKLKYFKNAHKAGDSSLDAASVNWGSTWRLPTWDEIQELIDKCTWKWTTLNNVNGYEVTGTNGNCIFLPAAGLRCASYLSYAGSVGYYWSSTHSTSLQGRVSILTLYNGFRYRSSSRCSIGRSVRPVSE